MCVTETFDGDKLACVVEHWHHVCQLDGLAADDAAALQEPGFCSSSSLDQARRYVRRAKTCTSRSCTPAGAFTPHMEYLFKTCLARCATPSQPSTLAWLSLFPCCRCTSVGRLTSSLQISLSMLETEERLAALPCSRDVAKKTYWAVMNGGNKDVNNLQAKYQRTPSSRGVQTEMKCV